MSQDPEPRSREQIITDQEEIAAHGAGANTGAQVAAQEHDRQRQAALLEELTDPDIFDGEHRALKKWLGPDFGRPQAIGQKEEEDVWRDRWLNENEADQILHEHNPGRLCFGPFLELAQGVHDKDTSPQKPLTVDAERDVRNALKTKTAYQTMAKNGKTFRGITEIVTTNKVERNAENEESAGRLSKIRNKLFG